MEPMTVDRQHGRCHSCSSTLDIVGADDCTLFVECQEWT